MSSNAMRAIASSTSLSTRPFIAASFCRESVEPTYGDAWNANSRNANCATRDRRALLCSTTWKWMARGIAYFIAIHPAACAESLRGQSAPMVSKTKFKDWTCEGCRHAQKAGQTAPNTSDAGPNVQPLEAEAPHVSSPPPTSTPKRRGWHPCSECHLERQPQDFS